MLNQDNSTPFYIKHIKWIALFIMVFITFSSYYTWEVFSPFKELLGNKYKFSSLDYGILQASFSMPSSVLFATIIGGVMMDRIGLYKIGQWLIILMIISGLITAYGISAFFEGSWVEKVLGSFLQNYSPRLKILTIGSFVFGIAAVNLFTMTAKGVAVWFIDKNYGFASSLNVAAIRIGTGGALIMGPIVYNLFGWPIPVYFILVFQFAVLILFTIYVWMYKVYKKRQTMEEKKKGHLASFKTILSLRKNLDFYLLVIVGALFYPILYNILRFAPDIVMNTYHRPFEISSYLSGIIPLTATIITPLTGYFIDRIQHINFFLILGSLLLMLGIGLLMIGFQPCYIPLFIVGLSFGVLPAAYWYIFGRILGKDVFATASGVMLWLQQTALWGTPIVTGYILQKTNPGVNSHDVIAGLNYFDYFYPLMYLLSYAVVNLIICMYLGRRYNKVYKPKYAVEHSA